METNKNYKNKKVIFIGGIHRSGTTPLMKLLGSSPKISIHKNTGIPGGEDEGQHIQTVYGSDSKRGNIHSMCLSKNKNHKTEICELITNENRIKLMKEWSKYWDLSKQILVEKTPMNLIQTRFLQEMVPNSYFINIIRHPLCAVRALYKWNNYNWITETALNNWISGYDILYSDMKFLKNHLLIRYEDFAENPNRIIREIEYLIDEELNIPINVINNINNQNDKYLTKQIPEDIYNKFEIKINKYNYSFTEIKNKNPVNYNLIFDVNNYKRQP
jgi:hypothetical protein